MAPASDFLQPVRRCRCRRPLFHGERPGSERPSTPGCNAILGCRNGGVYRNLRSADVLGRGAGRINWPPHNSFLTPLRMRILHVIPSVSSSQGGPSRAIVEMERVLSARGIDVTTATTNDDGDSRTLAFPCGKPVAGISRPRWYFGRTRRFYKLSIGLAGWLHKNVPAYDVVHVHGLFSFAPVIAAWFARRTGVPHVIRPYGVLAKYGMTKRHPFLKRLSLAVIERGLLRSASAVQFTSAGERREAEALGLRFNSVVIPLGIDVSASEEADARWRPNNRTELL